MFKLLSNYMFCSIFVFSFFSFCVNNQRDGTKMENNMIKNSPNESNEKAEINRNTLENYKMDNDIDPLELPLTSKIKGSYLKAISVALDAFKVDSIIPENKKNLENYDIELRQNKDDFFIYFSAHSTNEDKIEAREGGETTLGKSVMFIIGKKDFELKRRYFFM